MIGCYSEACEDEQIDIFQQFSVIKMIQFDRRHQFLQSLSVANEMKRQNYAIRRKTFDAIFKPRASIL